MSSEPSELSGPDFTTGVAASELAEGAMLAGHAEGEPVLLARQSGKVFAIGATCTHYGGPLAEGLLGKGTVHCPWHHACFDLATGRAVGAPALNPVSCWAVEQRDGRIRITGRRDTPPPPEEPAGAPASIVIVGAGAAGNAAAEELRAQGYRGSITMIGMEEEVPYDRPNLSKDYLAGNAPEEWIPLRTPEFYAEHGISLQLGDFAERIDAAARRVVLRGGAAISYDRLLLATGAEPIQLTVPVEDGAPVYYLRSLDDCRAIIKAAEQGSRAVVIGASFIGLEVAAALRMRKLAVHVVAPETVPFEKVLGRDVGTFLRGVHEENGVEFHLGSKVERITRGSVHLDNGADLAADLIVVGIGVRPRTALAESAGAALDKGVIVNERMETSVAGIYAAGDIARVPNGRSGRPMRVEHWMVAERQGQCAARNMLGLASPYTDVPFFWTTHYGTTVSYTGHADRWDRADLSGSLSEGDASVGYWSDGKLLAVATLGRDLDALRAERAMAEDDEATLEALVRIHR